VSVSGAGGAAEARVMPAPGRWQVAAVTFKGLPLAALGLPPALVDGRLDGTLGDLVARRMGGWLVPDTRNARREGPLQRLRRPGRGADSRPANAGATPRGPGCRPGGWGRGRGPGAAHQRRRCQRRAEPRRRWPPPGRAAPGDPEWPRDPAHQPAAALRSGGAGPLT